MNISDSFSSAMLKIDYRNNPFNFYYDHSVFLFLYNSDHEFHETSHSSSNTATSAVSEDITNIHYLESKLEAEPISSLKTKISYNTD